jgi:uncharacterized small protein (DUF1192 family)
MTIAFIAPHPPKLAKLPRQGSDNRAQARRQREVAMAEEIGEPIRRARDQALNDLVREDLELLGVVDLEERIGALEGEIVRTRAQLDRKLAGRAAADAFFAKPG